MRVKWSNVYPHTKENTSAHIAPLPIRVFECVRLNKALNNLRFPGSSEEDEGVSRMNIYVSIYLSLSLLWRKMNGYTGTRSRQLLTPSSHLDSSRLKPCFPPSCSGSRFECRCSGADPTTIDLRALRRSNRMVETSQTFSNSFTRL